MARAALLLAMSVSGCRSSDIGLDVERIGDAGSDTRAADALPAGPGDEGDASRRPDLAGLPMVDAPTSDGPAPATDAPEGRTLAESCTLGIQCASGVCADGVCCASACAGNCEACDLPGQVGTCSPVMGPPRGGRAPCVGQGTMCGGTCDGNNGAHCSYPPADVECAPPRCAAGMATTRSVCNGAGVCLPPTAVSCAPFSCDGMICAGGCGPAQPCMPGNYCDGGRCFPQRDSGSPCQSGTWCKSAACVDGRCCGSATCGPCQSCTGAGGSCARINAADDPGACDGMRTCSAAGVCLKKSGQACAAPGECASGHCNSGRCCTVASCGACGSCTGPGGTCTMVTTGTTWAKLPGLAVDIDVGANGAVWVLGVGAMPGGFGIYRWAGSDWVNVPGAATRIAVGPDGVPWVVNSNRNIFRWTGSTWQTMPGAAHDIDIGPDGSVWVIGANDVAGGHGIFRWDGTTWLGVTGGAVRIAVGPNGVPWVVNSFGTIYRRAGTGWVVIPGAAREIDVSADGVPWVIGTGAVPGGFGIFRWNGTAFVNVPGGGAQIGVGRCLPWIASGVNEIFRRE